MRIEITVQAEVALQGDESARDLGNELVADIEDLLAAFDSLYNIYVEVTDIENGDGPAEEEE